MEFRVLGPLEVRDGDGRLRTLGAGRQRAVLAVLLLHANEVVSVDRLIDDLWGEQAPPTAGKIVQNCVSQLRRTVGEQRLVTRGRGYMLEVEDGAVDIALFESLVAKGARDLESGDPGAASDTLREALALWKGRPLEEFAYDSFAQGAISRLEEMRVAALEERIEADLALGRHGEIVAELEELVRQYPLRERLRGQLMLALYRSGRQVEALGAYRAARDTLVEELGLEPSEELQRLERAILTHDPSLGPPPRAVAPTRPVERLRRLRSPRVLATVGAALAVAAGIGFAVVELTAGKTRPTTVMADSVAILDPETSRIVGQVAVGARPIAIAVGKGAVWVANADDGTVSRIDPETRKVVRTIGLGTPASDIAVGAGSVWVATGSEGTLKRIDPSTNTVVRTIDLSGPSELAPYGVYSVATGGGAVWVGSGSGKVLRIDPATNHVVGSVKLGQTPGAVGFGDGNAWAAHLGGRTVRIEPRSMTVTGTAVGPPLPVSLAVGARTVWVGDLYEDVWRIDPVTVSVVQAISLHGVPLGITADRGTLWVAGGSAGTLTRIDAASGTVVSTVALGNAPLDLAVGDGLLWVAVGSREAVAT